MKHSIRPNTASTEVYCWKVTNGEVGPELRCQFVWLPKVIIHVEERLLLHNVCVRECAAPSTKGAFHDRSRTVAEEVTSSPSWQSLHQNK